MTWIVIPMRRRMRMMLQNAAVQTVQTVKMVLQRAFHSGKQALRHLTRREKTVYMTIEADGVVKLGTCQHCVVREAGKPERAWHPDGDRELDFPRDQFLHDLAMYGIQVTIDQEYICP